MAMFTMDRGALKCRYKSETLWLLPWGESGLRVLARHMGEPVLHDYALLPQPETESRVEIAADRASIAVGDLRAEVRFCADRPDRLTVSYYNQRGELLLAERGGTDALKIRPRRFRPLPGGACQLLVQFEAQAGEKLYGMGQYQQETLNCKGSFFELAQRNSQASVPFVLSSRGYGFLWHNPAIGRATFGENLTEWVADDTDQMDYYLCCGDTPAKILERYSAAVGRAPMMPEYGLGFWQCKLRYWNQEELLRVAREYHRRGVHVDVIVIDFFHWPYMGDYRFEEEFWPDPKAMVAELKSMGMQCMVSIWPQVSYQSENFAEMDREGYLVRSDRGEDVQFRKGQENVMFFDFTNPEARAWLWELVKKNYYTYGIETFWLDEAEPEYGVYDFENYRYHAGPVMQVGNLYPQAYARAFYEGQKKEGQKDVVNLLRCAWAGSARYGALVWSGDVHSDFPTLRKQICAGLNMGLAGIPWWTTDIGGFVGADARDPAFHELLVRWFEWGLFCPVMRLHGVRDPRVQVQTKSGEARLNSGADNEIWSYGPECEAIFTRLIAMRETMRPYTRELMRQAHETGAPVIRTLFFEFPDDPAAWDRKDEYLYGPDVLVAPVAEAGARQREVYLPAGASWTDLADGTSYPGGQTLLVEAPLHRIPAFLRDGAHAEWVGALEPKAE